MHFLLCTCVFLADFALWFFGPSFFDLGSHLTVSVLIVVLLTAEGCYTSHINDLFSKIINTFGINE